MLHVWMGPGTHPNESCQRCVNLKISTRMSHVLRMNGSCLILEWVMSHMSHIWMRNVTHMKCLRWVASATLLMRGVTHLNESCLICLNEQCLICFIGSCLISLNVSYVWMSHISHVWQVGAFKKKSIHGVTHLNESCFVCLNESCLICPTESCLMSANEACLMSRVSEVMFRVFE